MNSLARFYRAECIKWLKGWVLLTALLAPICQTGFLFAILWFADDLVIRFRPGFEFWIELNYLAWNLVFLPIVTALISELSWDLESESKAWNLLLIQPVARRTHYLVKFFSHFSLILLSQILLAVLLIPVGLILRVHLDSTMGYTSVWGGVPTGTLLRFAAFSLLASIPLVAVHTWLSAHLPGLGIAIATAVSGTWICARLSGATPFMQLVPWGMASQIISFFDRWKRHIPWEFVPGSLVCAVLLVWLGTLDFSRYKEPKQ